MQTDIQSGNIYRYNTYTHKLPAYEMWKRKKRKGGKLYRIHQIGEQSKRKKKRIARKKGPYIIERQWCDTTCFTHENVSFETCKNYYWKKKPIFVNNLSIWELWVLCTRHINDEMRFQSRFSKTNTSMVFTRQHIIINGNNIAMNGSALTRHMPNMPCENSFSIINKELLIFCLYSLLYGTK